MVRVLASDKVFLQGSGASSACGFPVHALRFHVPVFLSGLSRTEMWEPYAPSVLWDVDAITWSHTATCLKWDFICLLPACSN